jgi:hypothetical protein
LRKGQLLRAARPGKGMAGRYPTPATIFERSAPTLILKAMEDAT